MTHPMSYPDLTAQAVAEALAAVGLAQADTDGCPHTGSGFSIRELPMDPPRLSVTWHSVPDEWSADEVHNLAATPLVDCALVLEGCGYETEFVADYPMGYLVVWTEGEF
jgi:hypothetical protein